MPLGLVKSLALIACLSLSSPSAFADPRDKIVARIERASRAACAQWRDNLHGGAWCDISCNLYVSQDFKRASFTVTTKCRDSTGNTKSSTIDLENVSKVAFSGYEKDWSDRGRVVFWCKIDRYCCETEFGRSKGEKGDVGGNCSFDFGPASKSAAKDMVTNFRQLLKR